MNDEIVAHFAILGFAYSKYTVFGKKTLVFFHNSSVYEPI